MALSADTPRTYQDQGCEEQNLPVQASSTIYVGSAVSIDTGGEIGPLATGEAGFYGFAKESANNASGSAGDINCVVYTKGVVKATVAGVDDNNDIGDIVYATDDGTFTLTASGGVGIGRVASRDNCASGDAWVRFESLAHEHWND